MRGIPGRVRDGDLVRMERALHGFAIHALGTGPTFGSLQDEHGPSWPLPELFAVGIVSGDESHVIPVAGKKIAQLIIAHPREDRRSGKLVSVEMQDGEHGAVG